MFKKLLKKIATLFRSKNKHDDFLDFIKKNQKNQVSVPNSVAEVDGHLAKFFKKEEISVFHELVSEIVHVDIYVIKPSEERPYYLLLSSGMSAKPMSHAPEADLRYAEVFILLPPTWDFSEEGLKDEANYFPIRILKQIARLPHQIHAWIGFGHTIAEENPEPYASNNEFVGTLILETDMVGEAFLTIDLPDRKINLYLVVPLYKEELNYKIENGLEELLKQFDKFKTSEILDVKRPNSCRKFKVIGRQSSDNDKL